MKSLASCLLAFGIALLPAKAYEIYNVLDGGVDPTGNVNAAQSIANILSNSSHRTLLIPKGATVLIDRINGVDLSIPANTRIILEGNIKGTSSLNCQGSVTIEGGGSISTCSDTDSRQIKVNSGTIVVQNISFVGYPGRPSGVVIMDDTSTTPKVFDSILVTGCTAINCGYLVHRQTTTGGTSSVKRATISNNYATSTAEGDAINWDAATGHDSNISITGNTIDLVTCSQAGFAGVGIAVAGNNFNANGSMTMASATSGVHIANNIIRNCLQGIHVEYCRDVLVTGNLVDGISSSYSPQVTDRACGIVLYANWNLVVEGNTVQNVAGDMTEPTGHGNFSGIFSGYGSGYTIGPKNVRIANNTLLKASLIVQQLKNSGDTDRDSVSLDIENNRIRNGLMWIWARGDISLRGNNVTASPGLLSLVPTASSAISVVTGQSSINSYLTSPDGTVYTIQNNVARTDLGTPSFSLTDPDIAVWGSPVTAGNSRIIASGNNFELDSRPSQSLGVLSGDTFSKVANSPGQIYSTNGSRNWSTEHARGQVIGLNSSVKAVISRIIYDSANSRWVLELAKPSADGLLDLSNITSGTITAPPL